MTNMEPTAEIDAHRCPSPAIAWVGDVWTCGECGSEHRAVSRDDLDGPYFDWTRVIPPAR